MVKSQLVFPSGIRMARPSAWICSNSGARHQAPFGKCLSRALEEEGASLKPAGLEVHIQYEPGSMELSIAPEALDDVGAGSKRKDLNVSSFTTVLQVPNRDLGQRRSAGPTL